MNAERDVCLNSVLNVKALVGAFNQEKALEGAFSVIVQLHLLIDLRHYQKVEMESNEVKSNNYLNIPIISRTAPVIDAPVSPAWPAHNILLAPTYSECATKI